MINSYHFGKIEIEGKEYKQDVVILKDYIETSWWRKSGHELCIDDIKEYILKYKPQVIIVGTGQSGMLKVLPETSEYLRTKNIELIIEKTGKACDIFNAISKTKKVMGAFHLTC